MIYDIKLTKKAIGSATRKDDQDTEYRVIGKRHLRIVICKHQVSLRVKTNVRNRRKSQTLGIHPFLDLATFERLGDEFLKRELAATGPDFSRVTYNQFFYELHLPHAQRHNKHWARTQALYERHVGPAIGDRLIQGIQAYNLFQVMNALPDSLSNASRNRVRAVIHRSFSLAQKFGIRHDNPCKVIELLPENNVVERILTQNEATAFITALLNQQDSPHCLALLLDIFIGGRIGNVISIKKSELAPDLSTVTFSETKSGKKQVIPVSDEGRWVLSKALALSDNTSIFLFSSSRSKSGHIAYPVEAFRRICKQAGIATTGADYKVTPGFSLEPLTIHCLRKSFSSAVLAHTGDIHCSSKLLGHGDVKTTSSRYAFYQQPRLMEAVNGAASVLTNGIPNFPKIESDTDKLSGLMGTS